MLYAGQLLSMSSLVIEHLADILFILLIFEILIGLRVNISNHLALL